MSCVCEGVWVWVCECVCVSECVSVCVFERLKCVSVRCWASHECVKINRLTGSQRQGTILAVKLGKISLTLLSLSISLIFYFPPLFPLLSPLFSFLLSHLLSPFLSPSPSPLFSPSPSPPFSSSFSRLFSLSMCFFLQCCQITKNTHFVVDVFKSWVGWGNLSTCPKYVVILFHIFSLFYGDIAIYFRLVQHTSTTVSLCFLSFNSENPGPVTRTLFLPLSY